MEQVVIDRMPAWPADAVERRPVASLVLYAKNARVHSPAQVSQIAASITEWGFTNPVLIDDKGILIAGHGRVLAAQQLGLNDVPVMVAAGWSKAQIAAYRLADNKLAMNATWDDEALRLELAELSADGFDLDLTGFSDPEVNLLLNGDPTAAPDEFGAYDEDIETEHVCPKCGYQFSGGKTAARQSNEA